MGSGTLHPAGTRGLARRLRQHGRRSGVTVGLAMVATIAVFIVGTAVIFARLQPLVSDFITEFTPVPAASAGDDASDANSRHGRIGRGARSGCGPADNPRPDSRALSDTHRAGVRARPAGEPGGDDVGAPAGRALHRRRGRDDPRQPGARDAPAGDGAAGAFRRPGPTRRDVAGGPHSSRPAGLDPPDRHGAEHPLTWLRRARRSRFARTNPTPWWRNRPTVFGGTASTGRFGLASLVRRFRCASRWLHP